MPTLSLREQIMQALRQVFLDVREGVGSDPFAFRWDTVVRHPLGDMERKSRYAVALVEGDENKRPLADSTNAFLSVEVNFFARAEPREEPATQLNTILLNIQRAVRQDPMLGGLAIDVREDSNTHTVDSFEDRQLEGSVFYTVIYKHAENDPRLQRGLP